MVRENKPARKWILSAALFNFGVSFFILGEAALSHGWNWMRIWVGVIHIFLAISIIFMTKWCTRDHKLCICTKEFCTCDH